MTQNLKNHGLFIRLGQTLAIALLLGVAASAAFAQVPNLRFSTDGAGTSSYGNASSSDGALRGSVQFKFNGSISNGTLSLSTGNIEVKLPNTPSGTRFYWLKDLSYYGKINRTDCDCAVVTYSTSDPTFKVLTISNLPASEYFSNTSMSNRWKGKMTVTIKFNKVSGVADQYRISFTPQQAIGNPPPAVSGVISSGRVSDGSNLSVR